MRIDIISAVPELLTSPFSHSILKRAEERGLLFVKVHDLRAYGVGKNRQIDDYQYGGGAGMVMMCEPIDNLISELKADRDYDDIIYMTPDGATFQQAMANQLSLKENLMIICGHYKGIDDRIRQIHVTREISVGDYVLSGGELAAAIVVDAIGRLIPGVLNDEASALLDTFQDDLLAPPIYTRPSTFKGHKVPDVLLSGNDARIDEWRTEMSIARTKERRPDLFQKLDPS
ncbi:MAG: tRNA (guanosine(37)-N1)-methyltransferase TrmD [Saprospiraceae bacterium]|nr:tRNA (guanosine(37)-N1)-methyltransferase TrmD [Saprospiraceae bacterium]MBP9194093.1 tRNA (guanosine(37)-N1)-methyltransferase TrmD [Saprospiraceae bacterium]